MNLLSVLADPVRREIIGLLHQQPLSAGEVAAHFEISRPAISRHLRLLRESGLVTVEESGRRRVHRFDPAPLRELDIWLEQYRDLWVNRFEALETEVHRTRRERERRESNDSNQVSTSRKVSA
jgi:DNA-binding transcriptional ArsR family regulator